MGANGAVLPNLQAALAYRVFAPDAFPRVREIAHKIVASALMYLPASGADLLDDRVGPYLERYAPGSSVSPARAAGRSMA